MLPTFSLIVLLINISESVFQCLQETYLVLFIMIIYICNCITMWWNTTQFAQSSWIITEIWSHDHSLSLTHWGRDKMDASFLTTFSNAFSWMKINIWNSIEISLKFIPKGPINNIPALVQKVAWLLLYVGYKPLSEPMFISLTHICVNRSQWVKPRISCAALTKFTVDLSKLCTKSWNMLRQRQNVCHLADGIFTFIFLNENCCILIQISLKFVYKVPNDKKSVMIQIMPWCWTGDMPLSEPMTAYRQVSNIRHTIVDN